ncbi:transaldolase [Candidatus Omnitrophota bacterium]
MDRTNIERLNAFGQSAWLDNISRSMIDTGRLKGMIGAGLRGLTSNPSIFDKSISASADYDESIRELKNADRSTFEIYDDLTVRDVRDAADLFRGVFEESKGLDGYVSLEVNPKLAFNTRETIEEAKRLYKKVGRPNLMLKVPSTEEGFEAIEELTACGINVNCTLIFSLRQYEKTVRSYMSGIERFLQGGGSASAVRSVASVFVSRIDTVADKMLDQLIQKEASEKAKEKPSALKGKAAVANSKLIYKRYREFSASGEFERLKAGGANLQRVLWGSTSAKNPAYSDIKYVSELTGKDTVNTLPEATFKAFLDHGVIEEGAMSEDNIKKAADAVNELKGLGIDVDAICEQLLTDGVAAFENAFDSLLVSIEKKAKAVYAA